MNLCEYCAMILSYMWAWTIKYYIRLFTLYELPQCFEYHHAWSRDACCQYGNSMEEAIIDTYHTKTKAT